MKDDTRRNRVGEVSDMLRGVPPKNILISFGDNPAKPLDKVAREQQLKRNQRKRRDEHKR